MRVNGVNGTNGKDGISVSSAEINSLGELVLSFGHTRHQRPHCHGHSPG